MNTSFVVRIHNGEMTNAPHSVCTNHALPFHTDVDDVLVLSHDPAKVMKKISEQFEIKNNEYGSPEIYLGAGISKFTIPDTGEQVWSMESKQYIKTAVQTVKDLLAEDGRELKGGKRSHKGPLPTNYQPELDTTKECDEMHSSWFRQIIGIFRWAIELGRIDILIEVSLLSQYQAAPREGHLEALYLIAHYLEKNPMKRILFDPTVPKVEEGSFISVDWTEIYGGVTEEDPPNMPEPLGGRRNPGCAQKYLKMDTDHTTKNANKFAS